MQENFYIEVAIDAAAWREAQRLLPAQYRSLNILAAQKLRRVTYTGHPAQALGVPPPPSSRCAVRPAGRRGEHRWTVGPRRSLEGVLLAACGGMGMCLCWWCRSCSMCRRLDWWVVLMGFEVRRWLSVGRMWYPVLVLVPIRLRPLRTSETRVLSVQTGRGGSLWGLLQMGFQRKHGGNEPNHGISQIMLFI